MIADWTPCGKNKLCINQKCVATNLTSNCNPPCSEGSVCTNHGKCILKNTIVPKVIRTKYHLNFIPNSNRSRKEIVNWWLFLLHVVVLGLHNIN